MHNSNFLIVSLRKMIVVYMFEWVGWAVARVPDIPDRAARSAGFEHGCPPVVLTCDRSPRETVNGIANPQATGSIKGGELQLCSKNKTDAISDVLPSQADSCQASDVLPEA
jgi:hypothetical protein